MRVVAGKYRGKNLESPKDDNVRPTTTRIKETIFNIIQFEVQDAVCLDLFCGSGALGIECLSRGAKRVVFVDKSKDSIELTNTNLKGIEKNYDIYMMDFLSYLRNAKLKGEKFDLIFLDPPYKTTLAEIAIEAILEGDLLSDNGKIIFEHAEDKNYDLNRIGYKQRTKVMGTVTCEFISKKKVGLLCGSFDPITKGHVALIEEAKRYFDEVIVACLINEEKSYMFTNEERLNLCSLVCENIKGTRAIYSSKMAIEVAKEENATSLIRGIRNDKDRVYEEEMAKYNKEHGNIDTLFLELGCLEDISSTAVREEIKSGVYKNVPGECVEKIIEYRGQHGIN